MWMNNFTVLQHSSYASAVLAVVAGLSVWYALVLYQNDASWDYKIFTHRQPQDNFCQKRHGASYDQGCY